MASDRTYAQGGANSTSGNFAREDGIASAYLRLQVAERGKWPGGRGQVIGSHHRAHKYYNEESPARIAKDVEEAELPLVERGLCTAADVVTEDVREGAIGFVATFTDRTTADNERVPVPAGWTS
jgi:hypothetical protein